jgi:hypothetical protein
MVPDYCLDAFVGYINDTTKCSVQLSIFRVIQITHHVRTQYGNRVLPGLTLSLLMSHICDVSKKFGECYQKTNKTEDSNKLTLLAFKIIAILHNSLLATFIKLLETVSKCLFRNPSIPKEAFADSFQKLYERYQQCVVKDGDYFEGQ